MFPLRDENPTLNTSVVTFGIVAVNVAAWILVQGMGTHPDLVQSICEFGFIPGELLGTLPAGTTIPIAEGMVCEVDAQGSWMTVFTSMFMHGGWFHLIINMWFLLIFGDNVEDAMGPARFVFFYLICGVGAVVVQTISNPSSPVPMVGASGAIGGVMGAYAFLFPRVPVHMLIFLGFFITRIVLPAYLMLGYWFFLQLISALPTIGADSGGVAFWAHAGGFATGAVLIHLFKKEDRVRKIKSKRESAERPYSRSR
jgi:membrane associated rhomboid family serine protease